MTILAINLAATLFLTGLGWSLQLVQLPILRPDQLPLHRRLNSRLMILPMAVEFASAAALAISQPRSASFAALVLWIPVGFATLRYSMTHSKSPDPAALRRWNLVRTVAWTLRSAILLYLVSV
jgi:hypothetical protein